LKKYEEEENLGHLSKPTPPSPWDEANLIPVKKLVIKMQLKKMIKLG
jgi:hypothetical protein